MELHNQIFIIIGVFLVIGIGAIWNILRKMGNTLDSFILWYLAYREHRDRVDESINKTNNNQLSKIQTILTQKDK
jgi:hypothetical protein